MTCSAMIDRDHFQQFINTLLYAFGDLIRVQIKTRFAIIGAQHDDHAVNRRVRFQNKRQGFQPVAVFAIGILDSSFRSESIPYR